MIEPGFEKNPYGKHEGKKFIYSYTLAISGSNLKIPIKNEENVRHSNSYIIKCILKTELIISLLRHCLNEKKQGIWSSSTVPDTQQKGQLFFKVITCSILTAVWI